MQPVSTTLRILWLALSVSTLLIAAVAFLLPPPRLAPGVEAVPVALMVVSAVIAGVSFLLPRSALAGGLKRRASSLLTEPEGVGRRVLRVDDAALRVIYAAFQAPFILSMALSEAVSLNGLVLSRLGFAPQLFAPLLGAGTLLALLRLPTEERVLAAAGRALSAEVDGRGR